jgi:hypothetical protein
MNQHYGQELKQSEMNLQAFAGESGEERYGCSKSCKGGRL